MSVQVRDVQDKLQRTMRGRRSERGVALVIAIFTLLLISVIGIAMILMAGTGTAIKTNYRSSMQAFYDAKAGLEEGRSRLWPGNANPLSGCVFSSINDVCYIVNPDPTSGETVDPTDPNSPYFDKEYQNEFSGTPVVHSVNSMWQAQNLSGPLYKWVRITPVTQQSSGTGSDTVQLFYDGTNSNSSGTDQILAVTSFAVTPNNSRRMVQSNVAQSILGTLNFPSAVTLDGNGVHFQGPGNGNFSVDGNDINAPPNTSEGIAAIGYTNSNDAANIVATPASQYKSPNTPNIGVVSLPALQTPSGSALLQTPSGLDALVQAITASADAVVTGPVTQSGTNNIFPAAMSASNPVVVVVNGDLTFNSWHNTGYGLLVVTGQLKYDPDATWDGIILVIGQGKFVSTQNGTGQINGALFIAQTRDSSGKLLPDPNLGAASFSQTGGGNGIYYSSTYVKAAQARAQARQPYQVLSFREIQQAQP